MDKKYITPHDRIIQIEGLLLKEARAKLKLTDAECDESKPEFAIGEAKVANHFFFKWLRAQCPSEHFDTGQIRLTMLMLNNLAEGVDIPIGTIKESLAKTYMRARATQIMFDELRTGSEIVSNVGKEWADIDDSLEAIARMADYRHTHCSNIVQIDPELLKPVNVSDEGCPF